MTSADPDRESSVEDLRASSFTDDALRDLEEEIFESSLSDDERARLAQERTERAALQELEQMVREQEQNELRAMYLAEAGVTSPRTTTRTWGIETPQTTLKLFSSLDDTPRLSIGEPLAEAERKRQRTRESPL